MNQGELKLIKWMAQAAKEAGTALTIAPEVALELVTEVEWLQVEIARLKLYTKIQELNYRKVREVTQ